MPFTDPRGPKAGFAGASTKRTAVQDLIDLVQLRLADCRPSPEAMSTQFALASLARATRLLESMLALRAAGLDDVVSLPLRPAMESTVCALYLLLAGDDAVEHVRGAHIRGVELLSEDVTQFLDTPRAAGMWSGPKDRLNWEQLGVIVGKALAERHPEEANAASILQRIYDGMYRGQSMTQIHAGAGAFGGHIFRSEGSVSIRTDRYSPDDGTGSIVLAGKLVAIAAHFIFPAAGLPNDDIDEVSDRIGDGSELALIFEAETAPVPRPDN